MIEHPNVSNIKKVVYLALFLLLFFTPTFVSLASPPAPQPECNVNGIIKSIKFIPAGEASCLASKNGCPTDMELRWPDRYLLDIAVKSGKSHDDFSNNIYCWGLYPIFGETSLRIDKSDVRMGDEFKKNDFISVVAHYNYFNQYSLNDKRPVIWFYVITVIALTVIVFTIWKLFNKRKIINNKFSIFKP